MNRTGIVYLLTCAVTGKVYVGQTVQTWKERWGVHINYAFRRGASTHLSRAIVAHGPDSFVCQTLESCIEDDLNEREQFWIAHYRSNDRNIGYNMSNGGDGGRNSLSLEVREKISRTKTGVLHGPLSDETKRRIGEANRGSVRTEEQRERIRCSRSYGPLSREHRLKISEGLLKVRVFKLDEQERADLLRRLPTENDASLSMAFGVSRKTVWRYRNFGASL